MGEITDLDAHRHQPHLRGPARCRACGYEWEAVAPVGVIAGLECPCCGTGYGMLQGVVVPETRFVCDCGSDVYYILPDDGCMCVMCGTIASGF